MILIIKQDNEENIEIPPSQLENLDMSLGMTYYGGKNGHLENSFSQKLLKNLEKILKRSNLEENVFTTLSQSLNYVYKDMKAKFLSDVCIELNIPKEQKGFLSKMTKFFSEDDTKNKSNNSNKNNIFLDKRYVNIDLNIDNSNTSEYFKNLQKKYTKEEYFQLLLFSQLGNMLDYENDKNCYDVSFNAIREKFSRLNFTNTCIVNDQMLAFDIDPELSSIDSNFMNNLQTMEREMYADVASILLKRNFVIQKNISKDLNKQIEQQINTDIEKISTSRLSAYINLRKDLKNIKINKPLENIGHLTVFALEDLSELVNKTNTILTEEEIHHISLKQTEKGMLKYMLLASQISPIIKQQLNTLFSLEVDDMLGIVEYKNVGNYQHSQQAWLSIADIVGIQWINNLNESIKDSSKIIVDKKVDNNEKEVKIFDNVIGRYHFEELMVKLNDKNQIVKDNVIDKIRLNNSTNIASNNIKNKI